MFNNLIQFPIESELLQWSAKQVIRDHNNSPMLFYRIKITGTFFPTRALEPYIQVGKIKSAFAIIVREGLEVNGYFDVNITEVSNAPIEFGYGEEAPLLRVGRRFAQEEIRRLDVKRLTVKPINLDRLY